MTTTPQPDAAMKAAEAALVEARGYLDRLGQDGVRERIDKALMLLRHFPSAQPVAVAGICHICGKPNNEPGSENCSGAHPVVAEKGETPETDLEAALRTVIAHILNTYGPDAEVLTVLEIELGDAARASSGTTQEGGGK